MAPDASLSGRSALVTGASRGIGAAVARALAAEGARVFVGARTESLLENLAREIGGVSVPLDVTVSPDVDRALDRVKEATGSTPDLVVNAAGVFDLGRIASTTLETLDRNLDVNLRGSFLVIRAVLPGMLQRGGGMIVNIGSVAGRRAFPDNGAYAASKFGLRGLHEVLLEEIRDTGVRAALVEPGAVDTPMWDPLDPDSDPMLPGREDMLSAVDVAEAIQFVVTRPVGVAIPLLQVQRG